MRKLLDKYIVIDWVDSSGLGGLWNDDEVVLSLHLNTITSIGRVINEDEDFITLVPHVSNYQLAGAICVPRDVIKKIRVLGHYKKIFDNKSKKNARN